MGGGGGGVLRGVGGERVGGDIDGWVTGKTDLKHLEQIWGGRFHVEHKSLHAEDLTSCSHLGEQNVLVEAFLEGWETACDVPPPPVLLSSFGTARNRLSDQCSIVNAQSFKRVI